MGCVHVENINGWYAGLGLKPPDVWNAVRLQLTTLQKRLAATDGWWHMYSVSVLVIYDGSACNAIEAKASCHLIDFAHCFCVPYCRDNNFARGLASLIDCLTDVADVNEC